MCKIMHFTLHFVAFLLAFSGILHCVLMLNALRFAANCTAFWCQLHCVLVLIAVQFAANCTFFVVNCPPFCIITHFYTANRLD